MRNALGKEYFTQVRFSLQEALWKTPGIDAGIKHHYSVCS